MFVHIERTAKLQTLIMLNGSLLYSTQSENRFTVCPGESIHKVPTHSFLNHSNTTWSLELLLQIDLYLITIARTT